MKLSPEAEAEARPVLRAEARRIAQEHERNKSVANNAEPYVRIETLTPEKAARWLSLNTHNRDLNPSRVRQLADAIRRDEWELNGDAFVFSGNGSGGVMLNGQHRGHAVIQAQKPIQIVVLYNAPFEAQETMDSGMTRTLGAKLKLRGEKYYNELAGALAVAFSYEKWGEPRSAGAYFTHQQLLSYLEEHPEIRDCASLGRRVRKEFGSPASSWVGWIYVARRALGSDLADAFFERLIEGADLSVGDPVFRLRKILLKQQATPTDRRYGRTLMGALLVKALNAYALGQDVVLLKWDVRESFPQLVTRDDLPG